MARLPVIIMMMMVLAVVFVAGCSTGGEQETVSPAKIKAGELDPAVWGKSYPLQYQSYLRNNEEAKTEFGGSVKESKFISEPEILELFKGYGFSKDYNEDRGHTYALEDMLSSGRVGPKTPGSCMTCKSVQVPGLIKEMGPEYYTMPVQEMAKEVKHTIACADCHDPETMDLRVTRPAFIEGMKERGIDISRASRQEMRSYVCGQCHAEYYFQKDTKAVVFPWDKGLEPENIEEYYDEMNFSDWEHPDSGAAMRKVQHPEFELWSSGVHGTAGVSCADCHMPYMREDGKKYSSHWWTSPLKTMDVSCGVCHRQDDQWLKERVLNTQNRTYNAQVRASKAIVEAHGAIREAADSPGTDQAALEEARKLVARAQWYWDWVAAENGRGFHNPVQALDSLALAVDLGHRAADTAEDARR